MRKRTSGVLFLLSILNLAVKANDFYPGAQYDPAIPTLEAVVGHDWGTRITSPAEIEAYLVALAERSPLVQMTAYGVTWEGRKLNYLTISSEQNLAALQQIQEGVLKLARAEISRAEADRLIEQLPCIVFLAYGIHGNEISSPEAALLTAYHLAAARDDSLRDTILENCVVIIDPLQNPDGRNRFATYFEQTRGRWPDADPYAAEHNETWPRGRSNHYLFDMNRDWFALTQTETLARVRLFLQWFPQVFVDLHEMGGNSTYYFPPPAKPWNPNLTDAQLDWMSVFGKNNGKWFDRFQFDYFTAEIFDSFYPGYGEGWPMFHGAIGMTYEQASVRGLILDREDDTTLLFKEAIRHHFIASVSTLECASTQRLQLLRSFFEYRASAVEQGRDGSVKEFILPSSGDRSRLAKLVNLLMEQGIVVQRARSDFQNSSTRNLNEIAAERDQFPKGTFIVSVAQPSGRLAKALLERHTPMGDEFIREQIRRNEKRIGDQIYDITGWSIPLLFGVECYTSDQASTGDFETLQSAVELAGGLNGDESKLAYLIPWNSNSAAKALSQLHRRGIRVFSSNEPFTINGIAYPRGSLIIKVKNNPDDLHEQLAEIAREAGVFVESTDTAWADEGVNLGSNNVVYLKRPNVAMAYGPPTRSSSVGATRFLLERACGYPVTVITTDSLGSAELNRYNVLVLPDNSGYLGGYSGFFGESGIQDLKHWIENGGTLITFSEATRWLTEEKVGLLETQAEFRAHPGKEGPVGSTDDEPQHEQDADQAAEPDRELPDYTPGAILRISLDTEHWLAFGYNGEANVMVNGRRIFTPLRIDKGRNVATYLPESHLLASGFTWEAAQKQLANKAYLMYQSRGRGHVVAFAEDPNFRAFMDGLNLLFLNSVFFGPAQ